MKSTKTKLERFDSWWRSLDKDVLRGISEWQYDEVYEIALQAFVKGWIERGKK